MGISAVSRADVRILPVFGNSPSQATTLVGQLIYSTEGVPYLFLEDETAIVLKGKLDLTAFHGQIVEVVGIEVKNNGGPVFETMSLDPLQERDEIKAGSSVFIVFKVKEISP